MNYVKNLLGYESNMTSTASQVQAGTAFDVLFEEATTELNSDMRAKLSATSPKSKSVMVARQVCAEKKRRASMEKKILHAREHVQKVHNTVEIRKAEEESKMAELRLKLLLKNEQADNKHAKLEKSKVMDSHEKVEHAKRIASLRRASAMLEKENMEQSVVEKQEMAQCSREQHFHALHARLQDKWTHHQDVQQRRQSLGPVEAC